MIPNTGNYRSLLGVENLGHGDVLLEEPWTRFHLRFFSGLRTVCEKVSAESEGFGMLLDVLSATGFLGLSHGLQASLMLPSIGPDLHYASRSDTVVSRR